MSALTRFDRDTAVTCVGKDRYEARIDRGWWVHRGPNGGYVAAIVLRSFMETVGDPERAPRSLTVHFTAPPKEGRVHVEAKVERAGRSLTTVSGRMWQGEQLCAFALGAFSRRRDAVEFQDAEMPRVPTPESVTRLEQPGPSSIPMRERFEQRPIAFPDAPELTAKCGGWVRPAEPRLVDAVLIAALTDCWPPSVRQRRETPILQSVPTVDLTIHFRSELPLPDARPDDFTLVRFQSSTARDGFFEEDGAIWAADGRLLAQSRQLGLLLSRD